MSTTTRARKIAWAGLKGLGWLLLALLGLLLAWLASNNRWVDAREVAVPAALQPPAPALPAERNGFFALLGLDAPAGQDPAEAGRRRWAAGSTASTAPPEAGALRWPAPGPDDPASSWHCRADAQDCLARWSEQAAALQALMREHAVLGERCEALASPGFAIDELRPEPRAEIRTPADQYAGRAMVSVASWIQCGRWLRVQAALAQQRGDASALQGALQRSQRYVNGLLTGARSLMGNLVAWAVAGEHWQLLTALAARQPALAESLAQLAGPLPAAALDPSRWMVSEAFYGRQLNRELVQACGMNMPGAGPAGWLERRLSCSPFGLMPQATQQLMDRQWLQALELARGGPLALLDWRPQPEGTRLFGVAWSNTAGHVLVDVAMPAYPEQGRRQADLLLRHQAALLALGAAAQPAARRAAWLAAQPLDERLRARIRLEGAQLSLSLWSPPGEPARPLRYPLSSFSSSSS